MTSLRTEFKPVLETKETKSQSSTPPWPAGLNTVLYQNNQRVTQLSVALGYNPERKIDEQAAKTLLQNINTFVNPLCHQNLYRYLVQSGNTKFIRYIQAHGVKLNFRNECQIIDSLEHANLKDEKVFQAFKQLLNVTFRIDFTLRKNNQTAYQYIAGLSDSLKKMYMPPLFQALQMDLCLAIKKGSIKTNAEAIQFLRKCLGCKTSPDFNKLMTYAIEWLEYIKDSQSRKVRASELALALQNASMTIQAFLTHSDPLKSVSAELTAAGFDVTRDLSQPQELKSTIKLTPLQYALDTDNHYLTFALLTTSPDIQNNKRELLNAFQKAISLGNLYLIRQFCSWTVSETLIPALLHATIINEHQDPTIFFGVLDLFLRRIPFEEQEAKIEIIKQYLESRTNGDKDTCVTLLRHFFIKFVKSIDKKLIDKLIPHIQNKEVWEQIVRSHFKEMGWMGHDVELDHLFLQWCYFTCLETNTTSPDLTYLKELPLKDARNFAEYKAYLGFKDAAHHELSLIEELSNHSFFSALSFSHLSSKEVTDSPEAIHAHAMSLYSYLEVGKTTQCKEFALFSLLRAYAFALKPIVLPKAFAFISHEEIAKIFEQIQQICNAKFSQDNKDFLENFIDDTIDHLDQYPTDKRVELALCLGKIYLAMKSNDLQLQINFHNRVASVLTHDIAKAKKWRDESMKLCYQLLNNSHDPIEFKIFKFVHHASAVAICYYKLHLNEQAEAEFEKIRQTVMNSRLNANNRDAMLRIIYYHEATILIDDSVDSNFDKLVTVVRNIMKLAKINLNKTKNFFPSGLHATKPDQEREFQLRFINCVIIILNNVEQSEALSLIADTTPTILRYVNDDNLRPLELRIIGLFFAKKADYSRNPLEATIAYKRAISFLNRVQNPSAIIKDYIEQQKAKLEICTQRAKASLLTKQFTSDVKQNVTTETKATNSSTAAGDAKAQTKPEVQHSKGDAKTQQKPSKAQHLRNTATKPTEKPDISPKDYLEQQGRLQDLQRELTQHLKELEENNAELLRLNAKTVEWKKPADFDTKWAELHKLSFITKDFTQADVAKLKSLADALSPALSTLRASKKEATKGYHAAKKSVAATKATSVIVKSHNSHHEIREQQKNAKQLKKQSERMFEELWQEVTKELSQEVAEAAVTNEQIFQNLCAEAMNELALEIAETARSEHAEEVVQKFITELSQEFNHRPAPRLPFPSIEAEIPSGILSFLNEENEDNVTEADPGPQPCISVLDPWPLLMKNTQIQMPLEHYARFFEAMPLSASKRLCIFEESKPSQSPKKR